jgi:hypothetical protein
LRLGTRCSGGRRRLRVLVPSATAVRLRGSRRVARSARGLDRHVDHVEGRRFDRGRRRDLGRGDTRNCSRRRDVGGCRRHEERGERYRYDWNRDRKRAEPAPSETSVQGFHLHDRDM